MVGSELLLAEKEVEVGVEHTGNGGGNRVNAIVVSVPSHRLQRQAWSGSSVLKVDRGKKLQISHE